MKLDQLLKIKTKSKKRLGRGLGSGKGKTAARGAKGQKKRTKIPATFIGGTLPLYRRLPLKRGKGNPTRKGKTITINLNKLNIFKAKSTIDMEALLLQKLIRPQDLKKHVKIVGPGKLKSPLIVKVAVTAPAAAEIKKVGGQVISA